MNKDEHKELHPIFKEIIEKTKLSKEEIENILIEIVEYYFEEDFHNLGLSLLALTGTDNHDFLSKFRDAYWQFRQEFYKAIGKEIKPFCSPYRYNPDELKDAKDDRT